MVSTPDPPDPRATAQAQFGANVDSAIANAFMNNYDETSPFGSVEYDLAGSQWFKDSSGKWQEIPRFNRTVQLTDEQQAILDQQNQASYNLAGLAADQSGFVRNYLNEPFNPEGLPPRGQGPNLERGPTEFGPAGEITKSYGPTDYSADRSRVEDAIMSRYNRHFADTESALDQKLRNQGLMPGTEAYDRQFRQMREMQNDATMQAILTGGQEQSRLAGLARDRATFENAAQNQEFGQAQARGLFGLQGASTNNQAELAEFDAMNRNRQQALEEAYAMRNQPLNEITAMLSGVGLNVPQFTSPFQTGIAPAPIADLIQSDYQNRLSASNAQAQGLFGLLSAGLGLFSDRRLKTHIRRIGSLRNGLNLYRYRFRHDGREQIGVMADEVAKVLPDAVRKLGGLWTVDYDKVAAVS